MKQSDRKRQILKVRAEKLASIPQTSLEAHEEIELLVFNLAHETYAIESFFVREVCRIKDITFLPCVPAFVYALMNLRRQIMPIIDLRPIFDLPFEKKDIGKSIVLKLNDREFALLTNGIVGIRRISISDIQMPLPTHLGVRQEFLKGITKEGIILLDGSKLIPSKRLVVEEG